MLLFVSVQAFSQCGVYLTADDFIAGKLTDEGSLLSIPSGRGEDDRVVITTKNGMKTHLFSNIYGYKNKLSVYRIIFNQPYILVSRGAINAFTPYGPISQTKKGVVYYRRVAGFGEVVITNNLHDKNPQIIADYIDLWKAMDLLYVGKVKDFVRRMSSENGDITAIPEQTIEYYNSLLDGYVPAAYTTIKVDLMMVRE